MFCIPTLKCNLLNVFNPSIRINIGPTLIRNLVNITIYNSIHFIIGLLPTITQLRVETLQNLRNHAAFSKAEA